MRLDTVPALRLTELPTAVNGKSSDVKCTISLEQEGFSSPYRRSGEHIIGLFPLLQDSRPQIR